MSGSDRPVAPGVAALNKLKAHNLLDKANAAFKVVNDVISDRAVAAKPRKLNYEVFHEQQVARMAFLEVIADATDMTNAIESAKEAALNAAGLGDTGKVAICPSV